MGAPMISSIVHCSLTSNRQCLAGGSSADSLSVVMEKLLLMSEVTGSILDGIWVWKASGIHVMFSYAVWILSSMMISWVLLARGSRLTVD